jgi:flagellar motor protein MotB
MDTRERKKKNDEVPAAGWEIIYCSLVLILVAFFAMLVSYSKVQGNDMISFRRGFAGESKTGKAWFVGHMSPDDFVNVYTGGIRAEERNGRTGRRTMFDLSGADESIAPGTDESGDTVNVYAGGDVSASEESTLRSLAELWKQGGDTVPLAVRYFRDSFENAGLQGDVDVVETKGGFRVTMTSSVLFPSAVAALNTAAYPLLDRIAKFITAVPFSVRVEGHTDNVPIATEAYPSNWELSTARAVNVVRYLLDAGKVSPQKIAAAGFGEYQPVASNESPEGRKKNRRVEFYFQCDERREFTSRKGAQ